MSAQDLRLQRTDNGAAVPAERAGQVLGQSSLLLTMPPGSSVAVYDVAIGAAASSAVLLTASSEYLAAAVLAGAVSSGDTAAEAGQVLVWNMDGGGPQRFGFDIGRLLASSSLVVAPEVRSSLAATVDRQKEQLFWGLLEPLSVNIQAPLPPLVEAVRRDYVLHPAMIQARRRAAGDAEALPRIVAESFVAALAQRDTATVRDLLDPAPFQASAAQGASWLEQRDRFAAALTAGPIPAELAGYTIEPGGQRQFGVRGERGTYVIELSGSGNALPFVRRFEQQ